MEVEMKLDPPLWQILTAMAVGGLGAILTFILAAVLLFPAG
jgi:hypothetical protein